MSEEQLKAFLEKVKGDTSLQEKLNGAADAEAVVEIAQQAGFSVLANEITNIQSENSWISDAELERVAGGRVVIDGKIYTYEEFTGCDRCNYSTN